MVSVEVVVVGGGPGGSSCAWALGRAGVDALVLDRARFSRQKVCAGWITPGVVQALELDLDDYARDNVLQAITGFRTGLVGGREIETSYTHAVSYGILRRQLDHHLLRRSGARVDLGKPVTSLRRCDGGFVVNESVRARVLVGAGGHFCPVARWLGARPRGEPVVAAQEIELRMDAAQRARCRVRPEVPELYFTEDLKGYGWCFRKGDDLNVGFGRMDAADFPRHVRAFADFLNDRGRPGFELPSRWDGHAYLLYDATRPKLIDDGVLLVGDAAGLAYAGSGEGIRPAVESGLLAAQTVIAAEGGYERERLEPYRRVVRARFGESSWMSALPVPSSLVKAAGRVLLSNGWLTRRLVLDRFFLRSDVEALPSAGLLPVRNVPSSLPSP
jgi:flavin-dependent dehydrogenase